MAKVEPIEVEYRRGVHELRVAWEDGHESRYPARYLRGLCPCANCQGHGGAVRFVDNEGPDVAAMHEVGAYALGLHFADQHKTGIFAFDYLRRLCPCQACRQEQGERHFAGKLPTDVAAALLS